MELKEYQQKTLTQVRLYLEALSEFREKSEHAVAFLGPDMAIDFPAKAWERVGLGGYRSRKNGLGEWLPNFCLKIPTGGGKTLLATKVIDLVQTTYLKRHTGLVLWVVPTTQIYRQTIKNLRDHDHPYRQHLDIASGGRTAILEKTDRFTSEDVNENLVVMMLMLPSASRQNKETLKVFRDSGGFAEFFPSDDDADGHARLLEQFPNLDCFDDESSFFPRQAKTSLGNTLRMLSPIIILDEGHKAYSETAQGTLRGFNPVMIVELSATPLEKSNVLVDIKGAELNREEMIKLDLHITNKASIDWKDTLLSSIERRDLLEQKAREYEANTGQVIRPICLIQVERTGRDQRGSRFIHAEDAREYLTRIRGVPENQVAVKSSEKDDIEGIDLLSRDCPVRYIITKQALQEGWDCSFAYVLTLLTNPASKNNLTQLVGRILRQPFAQKTGIRELDESYVFCSQQKAANLLANITAGFGVEGLGDLTTRIVTDETPEEGVETQSERIVELRERFKHLAGTIYLPVFVVRDGPGWRQTNYEVDILGNIDWKRMKWGSLKSLTLSATEDKDIEMKVGLGDSTFNLAKLGGLKKLKEGGLTLDYVFAVRHLNDIVPNPWVAYDACKQLFGYLLAKYDLKAVTNNLVFILEELRKHVEREKDRLAEEVFRKLVNDGDLRFLLLKSIKEARLPNHIIVNKLSRTLNCSDGQPLQKNLFDFVPEEDFNSMEQSVAWYLEEQGKLLWWYRNISRQDYSIQGWRKHRIYPDFIFTEIDEVDELNCDKVFVVETKGLHLKNEDTGYKEKVFALCNQLAEEKSWDELKLEFPDRRVVFKVIFEDEWQKRINELFAGEHEYRET
ncbi:MAG: DEAD/DEAH box helicase family protein [Dehalococcoidia bacterium]|nr:DEAD/DEAH box helicase family protein [Dehalococcoidia bacterium]